MSSFLAPLSISTDLRGVITASYQRGRPSAFRYLLRGSAVLGNTSAKTDMGVSFFYPPSLRVCSVEYLVLMSGRKSCKQIRCSLRCSMFGANILDSSVLAQWSIIGRKGAIVDCGDEAVFRRQRD